MAAVYQASRDDVQACIGRSHESWARRTANGSRSKQKRKNMEREGARSAAAGEELVRLLLSLSPKEGGRLSVVHFAHGPRSQFNKLPSRQPLLFA